MRIERLLLSVFVAISIEGAFNSNHAPPSNHTTSKIIVLFDGKSLKGWEGDTQIWSVKDGVIDGVATKTSGSYLSTNDDYSDFRLIFQERKVWSNNHLGVGFWAARNAPGDYGPNKCVLVITPPGAMWDYGSGNLKNAMLGNRYVNPDAPFNFDWQQVEIVVRQSTGDVLAAVDGAQITKYTDPEPSRFRSGPIRLQLHGFPSWQEMQYKNVRVETNPRDFKLITLAR